MVTVVTVGNEYLHRSLPSSLPPMVATRDDIDVFGSRFYGLS